MVNRVAVLLGAGASADAGLPLTTELAAKVVALANAEHRGERPMPDWVRALNFVYGSMVGYQAEDGSDPLAAVNIERLISALRLLSDAKAHEVAPFVANWKAGALGFGAAQVTSQLGDRAMSAIKDGLGSRFSSGRALGDAIASIARNATKAPDPRAFEEAETHLLAYLADLLNQIEDTAYLEPLADLAISQPGGLDILTLNYDLTVETMARARGIPVDRGIGAWRPGGVMKREQRDDSIRLHKLHGSLDWELQPAGAPMEPPNIISADRPGTSKPHGDDGIPGITRRRRPWIVVGDREKLATDGPTLDLLHSATAALRQAEHLVIVGYSFSDRHVNAMIRDWMAASGTRTVGVLDLNWQPPLAPGFCERLVHAYGHYQRERRESRVVLTAGTAANALATALAARPTPSAELGATVSHTVESDHVVSEVTLLGPDLYNASLSLVHHTEPKGEDPSSGSGLDSYATLDQLRAQDRTLPRVPHSWRPLQLDVWRTGETVVVFSVSPPPGGTLRMHFRGRRLDGIDETYGNLSLS